MILLGEIIHLLPICWIEDIGIKELEISIELYIKPMLVFYLDTNKLVSLNFKGQFPVIKTCIIILLRNNLRNFLKSYENNHQDGMVSLLIFQSKYFKRKTTNLKYSKSTLMLNPNAKLVENFCKLLELLISYDYHNVDDT